MRSLGEIGTDIEFYVDNVNLSNYDETYNKVKALIEEYHEAHRFYILLILQRRKVELVQENERQS